MKRKAVAAMMILAMAVSITACGTQKTDVSVNETETTAETEAHVHAYKEEVTKEASCEETGEKTFTCVCGESYTESIPATGHAFESYVYNEDATYLADGTKTAVCKNCEAADTVAAEGTKLAYTFKELSATKYAKQEVNVRNLPGTDGEKVGALSRNQKVTITGQCNETDWYRIKLDGKEAYVSNKYLVDSVTETVAENTGTDKNKNTGTTNAGNANAGNVNTGNTNTDNNNTGTAPQPENGSSGGQTTGNSGTPVPESGDNIAPQPQEQAPEPQSPPAPQEPVENPNNLPILPENPTVPGWYWDPFWKCECEVIIDESSKVWFDQYGNKYDHPVDAEGNPI